MANIIGDEIEFDTGRSLRIAHGAVAIGHGYQLLDAHGSEIVDLSPREAVELADVMLERWTAYREAWARL